MKRPRGIGVAYLLAGAIVLGTPWLVLGAEETTTLSTPEIGWAIKVKAPSFALDQKHNEPGGNAYFMASDRARQMILAGRIERAKKQGPSRDAREYFWERTKKTPFKMDDIKMSESGNMATVEFMVPRTLLTTFANSGETDRGRRTRIGDNRIQIDHG